MDPNLSALDYSNKMHHFRNAPASEQQNSLQKPAYGQSKIDEHMDQLKSLEYEKSTVYTIGTSVDQDNQADISDSINQKMERGQEFFFSLEQQDLDAMRQGNKYFREKRYKQMKDSLGIDADKQVSREMTDNLESAFDDEKERSSDRAKGMKDLMK